MTANPKDLEKEARDTYFETKAICHELGWMSDVEVMWDADGAEGFGEISLGHMSTFWPDENGDWWVAEIHYYPGNYDDAPDYEIANEQLVQTAEAAMVVAMKIAAEQMIFGVMDSMAEDAMYREYGGQQMVAPQKIY